MAVRTVADFNPPDFDLIDSNPLTFREQLQALFDRMDAHQAAQGDLEEVNAQLRVQLDQATQDRAAAEQNAQSHAEAAEALRTAHGLAVSAYRQAMLGGDPSLPPELVQGDTVADVDAALAKARGVVDYIRNKLHTPGGAGVPGQTATAPVPPPRVPAGAPGRTLPDVSAMTAREKLIFGTSRQAG